MAYGDYQYDVRNVVQLHGRGPAWSVTWRGQLKLWNAATGYWYRVNIYALDNGYWDVYFEDEIAAAFRGLD